VSDFFNQVRAGVVGEGRAVRTPFGPRRMTYLDHAASGRAFAPIETWIFDQCLPLYANTHSETSAVAAQTTAFREEARRVVREACACTDEDAVVFCGNGATGAIHTLFACMGLTRPCTGDPARDRDPSTVIFVGSYEHHSVEIAARESRAIVEVVRECAVDGVDLDHLRELCARHAGRRLIGCFSAASNVTGRLTDVAAVARVMHAAGGVALFDYAAAGPYVQIQMNEPSPDPGAVGLPPDEVAQMQRDAGLPDHVWRATAERGASPCPDAVFISTHKFLGGPGAPGVLVAKRHLFQNRVPSVPGGGTVANVTPRRHTFLADVEHREEGGTPDVVGAIRAGLAFRLKSQAMTGGYDCARPTYEGGVPYGRGPGGVVGTFPPAELRPGGACSRNLVLEREQEHARQLIGELRAEPGVEVLGDPDAPRLGIVSFVVHVPATPRTLAYASLVDEHRGLTAREFAGGLTSDETARLAVVREAIDRQETKCLHHNFVVALLNDLFGIQARGGNACAAPYAHRLLRVSERDEDLIDAAVQRGWHGCKPGWTRLSFGWYDADDTVRFAAACVKFIARHGWRFLSDYAFDPRSGTWRHRAGEPPRLRLGESEPALVLPEEARWAYLAEAEALTAAPRAPATFEPTPFEALRWFWLPGEV
jgi:selenocysteine lyase/cysteine desulfurase